MSRGVETGFYIMFQAATGGHLNSPHVVFGEVKGTHKRAGSAAGITPTLSLSGLINATPASLLITQ